ncbi:ferric reductase like transmembrane component-domain-containing protein [Elsinoe ampelina]|uniref:Ferric reductase like transmembrane component-domain-containing protein n=1 Tax=Elsinoe ampelina TaxID=302913 RepID=A0A6A6GB48_9PEZI|nr:ferric reductase like transmembrane component-domain-containing protein [Elsinoe ampelina]
MDGMEMTGTPWFMGPVQLHAYREFECSQNTTEECDYYQGYWHFWYESDHRFALPTVAFFTATILLFALAATFHLVAPRKLLQASLIREVTYLSRFVSYRSYRLSGLNWNSAPLGVLVLGVIGVLYFGLMTLVPQPYYWPDSTTLNYWGGSPPLATRSGWLSLGCMPFVFLTAGKTNWIGAITGVPHERLQVFHRWISYAFFVTALIHTFPFIVYNIKTAQMEMQWRTNMCYWTGVIAIIAQGWLTFASMGPLRNMSYEWFKFSHYVAGLVFMVFLFLHCAYTLSSWDYFIVTGVFFSLSWLYRYARVYFEHGLNNHATLSMTSNGFIRVSVQTKARWHVDQHFFVRFRTPDTHALTVHPFTACSLPSQDSSTSELVFLIRPRGGLTCSLAKRALASPNTKIRVSLDGPYGGIPTRTLRDSQHQLIIAGGSGVGWVLPLLQAFIRQKELDQEKPGTDSRTMKIILATREKGTGEWFGQAITESLAEAGDPDLSPCLEVEVHATGSASSDSPSSPPSNAHPASSSSTEKLPAQSTSTSTNSSSADSSSSSTRTSLFTIKHLPSRPDLPSIVAREADRHGAQGHLDVFVCGPLSMQYDVGNAVAEVQLDALRGRRREVRLYMEHFSWA